MIPLAEFLHQARAAVVADLAATQTPAGGDPARVQASLMRGYDGLIHMLEDPTGAAYRHYVDWLIVPQLRAGMTVADLHQTLAPLLQAIRAAITAQIRAPAERAHLREQLDLRVQRAARLWETVATRVRLEGLDQL